MHPQKGKILLKDLKFIGCKGEKRKAKEFGGIIARKSLTKRWY
jgi:hypothetical protein